MHPSFPQRRAVNVPIRANHTSLPWEKANYCGASQSPAAYRAIRAGAACPAHLFGGYTGSLLSPIGDSPGYETIMGQASSAEQQESLRKAGSSILREDAFCQEVEKVSRTPDFAHETQLLTSLPALSREDSWLLHYDCTEQAPYSGSNQDNHRDDRMITQTSLLGLPRNNELHDLAFFLRTTGPTAPHRKPSKIGHRQKRTISASKSAVRFLRLGSQRRRATSVQGGHEKLNDTMLRDEGGLLSSIPADPKMSSTGKRYLALRVPDGRAVETHYGVDEQSEPSVPTSDVLDSRISICFHHEADRSSEVLNTWLSALDQGPLFDLDLSKSGIEDCQPSKSLEPIASQSLCRNSTPIRPAASNPPTPPPQPVVPGADFDSSSFKNLNLRCSTEHDQNMVDGAVCDSTTRAATISLPKEKFPVRHPRVDEIEIKHPLPRRLASHPVLSQRASTIASSDHGIRTEPDSPGSPPPRSPLRLRRDPITIASIIDETGKETKTTPKLAPSIKSPTDFDFSAEPFRAIVTTECTGPIRRPKSSGKGSSTTKRSYPRNRKEREERIRARRQNDRPMTNRTIDPFAVHRPDQTTRQKLQKLRPQLQIPDLHRGPHEDQLSGTSADASNRDTSEQTRQLTSDPILPIRSEGSTNSGDEPTGYTPISPTASTEAKIIQDGLCLSPVTLIAEEVPIPKPRSTPMPAKLILKEGKVYAPRPRSASIPRSAMKRKSRVNGQGGFVSPPKGKSPRHSAVWDEAEDSVHKLPSRPPICALPPTPGDFGSVKTRKANSKAKMVDGRKDPLSAMPSQDGLLMGSLSAIQNRLPHIATQQQKKDASLATETSSVVAPCVNARLEALERQNALLSAALMAVLRTNGALNNPPSTPGDHEIQSSPMVWESRVARRSAATNHTASSSNGSALEMYINTRRGSRFER